MVRHVRRLLELIRFSHTLFALPFALLGAAMAWADAAGGNPPEPFRPLDLIGILLAMVFARSAAMAFNRLADRRYDAMNPRTRQRHLPAGLLGVRAVAAFTAVCSLGFVASTALFLEHGNWIPLAASLPVLAWLFGYSLAKRWTDLSHFWLGASLMLAPLGAWVAIRGWIALAPVVLAAAVLLWVAGFDIIYACQDYEFDRRSGLRSLPARLGVSRALAVAAGCHVGMVALLVVLPLVYEPFGGIFLAGVVAVGALLLYEHWIVQPSDPASVNRAFFHVNAVVSFALFVGGCADLWF